MLDELMSIVGSGTKDTATHREPREPVLGSTSFVEEHTFQHPRAEQSSSGPSHLVFYCFLMMILHFIVLENINVFYCVCMF